MKLHLGCGSKYINNFINIDILDSSKADIICDVVSLEVFQEKTIDLIYACHVLEHFGRNKYKDALKRWFDLLKPNGILRLSVPDIEACFNFYSKTKELDKIIGLLYGKQDNPYNIHYIGFDFNSIKTSLIDIGFKEIKRYDWKNTEHFHIDDFSQAYLPHMDKENGMLMSLNIEAVK